MGGIVGTGTEWVAPGQGATVHELSIALNYYRDDISQRDAARYHLFDMKGWRARTNLRLTGAPLTVHDVERIKEAK